MYLRAPLSEKHEITTIGDTVGTIKRRKDGNNKQLVGKCWE